MTIGRAPGVCSVQHMANLTAYLNDERVVERWGVNIPDPENWSEECAATRAAFGHDKPAAGGSSKSKSRTTLGYHLILAFNPDECAMSGGATKRQPISQAAAMEYANEYITRFYPNQEAVITLHDEGGRWATHCFINRTNLETGNRYHASNREKFITADRTRILDRAWGLREVVPGKRNSKQQAQAGRSLPKKAKEEMHERGVVLHSDVCRRKILAAVTGATSTKQFHDNCVELGIVCKEGKYGQLQFRDTTYRDERGRAKPYTNGSNLGGGCTAEELRAVINQNKQKMKEATPVAEKQASESHSKTVSVVGSTNHTETEIVPPEQDGVDVLALFQAELEKTKVSNHETSRTINSSRDVSHDGRADGSVQQRAAEPDIRDAKQSVRTAQQRLSGIEQGIQELGEQIQELGEQTQELDGKSESAEQQARIVEDGIRKLTEVLPGWKRAAGAIAVGIGELTERIADLRVRVKQAWEQMPTSPKKLALQLERTKQAKQDKESGKNQETRAKGRKKAPVNPPTDDR